MNKSEQTKVSKKIYKACGECSMNMNGVYGEYVHADFCPKAMKTKVSKKACKHIWRFGATQPQNYRWWVFYCEKCLEITSKRVFQS